MKLVIHNKGRAWGGNEKWAATLAAGLLRRGHAVVVSCPPDSPAKAELARRGIPTCPVRPGGMADVPGALRFARWLRSEQPDALLLTSWNRTFWGAWAGRQARVPRVVVRLGILRTLQGRLLEGLAFRRWVDRMIVNSADIRNAWLQASPWYPAAAVRIVLNGIAVPERNADERARLRAEFCPHPGALLITGVGHLARRKGFDLLIEAFAQAALPQSRLLIVGDGEERAALGALAARLGVGEDVHFLGTRADGAQAIAASDIFVLSSRNEGMANVMLEAMAAGVAVVAADVSGVREALAATRERPAAGWILPPDDPARMAETLREVAADLRRGGDNTRLRVAEAAFRARQWFSVERMLDEAEQALFGS